VLLLCRVLLVSGFRRRCYGSTLESPRTSLPQCGCNEVRKEGAYYLACTRSTARYLSIANSCTGDVFWIMRLHVAHPSSMRIGGVTKPARVKISPQRRLLHEVVSSGRIITSSLKTTPPASLTSHPFHASIHIIAGSYNSHPAPWLSRTQASG
jgi:hypothetical protein